MNPMLQYGPMGVHRLIAALCLLLGSSIAYSQHATGSDLFGGEQAFQNFCANCHGAAGNQIANVDLGRGVFRKPYSDSELTDILIKGIPGTPMPATPGMSPEQATRIVAYLRSRAVARDPSDLLARSAARAVRRRAGMPARVLLVDLKGNLLGEGRA